MKPKASPKNAPVKKRKPAQRKLRTKPLKAVDQAVGSVLLDIDTGIRRLNRKLDGLADAADEMKERVKNLLADGLVKMLAKLGPLEPPKKAGKKKRTQRKKSAK